MLLLAVASFAFQVTHAQMTKPIVPSPLAIKVMAEGKKHGWVGHLPILGLFQGGQPTAAHYVYINFNCGSHGVRIDVMPDSTPSELKAAREMFKRNLATSHRKIALEPKLEGTGLFVTVLEDPNARLGNGKTNADYSTVVQGIVGRNIVMFETMPTLDGSKEGQDKSLKDLYSDTIEMAKFIAAQLKQDS
jgi:hypothetical protein